MPAEVVVSTQTHEVFQALIRLLHRRGCRYTESVELRKTQVPGSQTVSILVDGQVYFAHFGDNRYRSCTLVVRHTARMHAFFKIEVQASYPGGVEQAFPLFLNDFVHQLCTSPAHQNHVHLQKSSVLLQHAGQL